MADKAIILARGVHAPWATGIASYGRQIIEAFLKKGLYNDIILYLFPDWHRLHNMSIVEAVSQLTELGVKVFITRKRPFWFFRGDIDIHILAERTMVVGKNAYKYLYVYPNSPREAKVAGNVSKLLSSVIRFVGTTPTLMKEYGVEGYVLPPLTNYVNYWGRCNPPFKVPERYLVYIGWVRPDRIPINIIGRIIKETDLDIVIVGRKSEAMYKENEYINIIKKIYNNRVFVYNYILKDCEKRWLLENSQGLLFPPKNSFLNPPVVDPPLIILEALSLGVPVLATPVLSIPWLASMCENISIIDGRKWIPRRGTCARFWSLVNKLWRYYFEILGA